MAQTDFTVRPLKGDFAVEITGVDVKAASDATLERLKRTLYRHGVIVVRGQVLTPDEQLKFTRVFGEPEDNANNDYAVPGVPEVYVISNKVVNGRRIGDPEAGINWHTDFTYGVRPALCTILFALEVPDEGSDTLLADFMAVWNEFPEERKNQIRPLKIQHSYAYLQERRGRSAYSDHKDIPADVIHPMVRKMPEDGRETLWVALGTARCVVGMPNPQGHDLIRELVDHSTQDRFVYRHKWKVGDLLIWDNRRSMHTGTRFDMEKYVRHIHRTWVRGEVPIPA